MHMLRIHKYVHAWFFHTGQESLAHRPPCFAPGAKCPRACRLTTLIGRGPNLHVVTSPTGSWDGG